MRDLVHTLFFQRRKQFGFSTAGLQSRNRQRFGAFDAGQFVGLGQQNQKLQAFLHPGANHVQQHFVELGQPQARVAQQDNAFQVFAGHQVVGHDPLPADLVLFGDRCIAVTGQIGQHCVGQALLAQREQVDVLGATWPFGCVSELLLLRQGVDAGRFSRVGAADEGNFRHHNGWQMVQLRCGGQKTSRVHPAHGRDGRR